MARILKFTDSDESSMAYLEIANMGDGTVRFLITAHDHIFESVSISMEDVTELINDLQDIVDSEQ